MVVVGVGLPLQGWMWALDGILIGAGDFRYLALTCALASAAHIATLCALVLAAPLLPSGLARVALLWAAFDIVLMGGRALANGLRIRSGRWMR